MVTNVGIWNGGYRTTALQANNQPPRAAKRLALSDDLHVSDMSTALAPRHVYMMRSKEGLTVHQ